MKPTLNNLIALSFIAWVLVSWSGLALTIALGGSALSTLCMLCISLPTIPGIVMYFDGRKRWGSTWMFEL